MPAQLLSTRHGETMVLTLHNPDNRNALGPEIYAAGIEALNSAGADIRSVVIVGQGNTFCAGGNLERLKANRERPPEVQAQSIEGLHLWIEELRAFPRPVIAAVEGAAAGAGFSLALACDFIVAARDAFFVMSYSSVALSPDGGGSWHLPRLLPRPLVNELLMLGTRIEAERLHALGAVNQLATPGSALTEAMALADRLNRRAPNALASIKELVNKAPHTELPGHLAAERDRFVRNLHHPNAGVGIEAFLAKTTPRYA